MNGNEGIPDSGSSAATGRYDAAPREKRGSRPGTALKRRVPYIVKSCFSLLLSGLRKEEMWGWEEEKPQQSLL